MFIELGTAECHARAIRCQLHLRLVSSLVRWLNVLLSFAQFEREVTGERIRDKIAASKRKGIWMGGVVPLGYARRGRLGVGRWSRQARISRKSAAMAVIFLAAIEVRSHSLSLIAHEGGRDKTAAP